MKRRILDLHLYLSLLCAPYLVVYGLSTLSFNHGWEWISPGEETYVWQQEAGRPEGDTDLEIAAEIRDSLGLTGGIAPWQVQNSTDELLFVAGGPGKRYEVSWSPQTNVASVRETRSGFWGVMRALHGLGTINGTSWGWMWRLYTLTSVGALMFAVTTGLYLWWGRLPSRRSGIQLLLWGSGGALAFMLYIVW